MRRVVGSSLVVALLVVTAGCRSSGGGAAASLAGTVSDFATGRPIAGAEVALGQGSAQTGDDGHFEFAEVAVGTREVTVTASGYDQLTQSVVIEAGANTVALKLYRWGSRDGGVDGPAQDGPGQHDAGQQDGPRQQDAAQQDGPRQQDGGPQDGPCGTGTLYCGGGCATCPAGATNTQCSGSQCVALSCTTGYRLCGSGCCAWTIQLVGTVGSGASEAAIALDSSGQPRIVYSDWNNSVVKYAYKSGGSFATETISSVQGDTVNLAVDGYGTPHVAFSQSQDLKYATRGTGWGVSTVYNIGLHPAIAVDPYNAVHLAFMGYTSSSPIVLYRGYKSYGSSSWRFDSVDNRGTSVAVGYNTSIAVGSTGLAQILYWVSGSGADSLWHAYESGGYFYPGQVDAVGFVFGDRGSIALDSAGTPYVGYPAYVSNQTIIKAGFKSGGSWYLAQADTSTQVYGSASIAMGGSTPHGVYSRTNGSTPEVVYATQDGLGWRSEVVANGEVWSNRALAFDGAGNPHVVFVSPYGGGTRYVYYAH